MHHGHVTAGATLARMAGVTDCTRVYHGAPVLRPQSNVCNIAGIARAPLVRREETAPAELYAATFVSLLPVRGGVLDAPRSDYCRAALDAPVRRGLLYPRFPRCARFASTTQRMQSRGHSPRTISHGRTHFFRSPTPGGRGSPPLRWVERHPHLTHVAPTPQSRREAP